MRIAVPAGVLDVPETLGHGRVWHGVIRELRRLARVRLVAPGAREPRADAWLIDCGAGAIETSLPVVGQLHEAPWTDPLLRDHTTEAFNRAIEARVDEGVAVCSRLITASVATREQIARGLGYPAERIAVAPHGVDTKVFRPGAAREGGYVLFAASVHPRKNLGALREAMTRLAARGFGRELRLVLTQALDRDDSSALEAAACAPLEGVTVTRVEPRPDDAGLAALMAGCDAFCLPSLWEGFGMTALEALACGAPVVVSDRGPLPEVVGDAGVVAAPTPEGLEAALERVLAQPGLAQDLRGRARARAETFTWRRTAQGWLSAVEAAL